MAGDISQFFGGIKSIQRGTVTVSSTATITSVDTTKTELRQLGFSSGSADPSARIVLTNATTITCTGGGSSVASWELTEYY